MIRLILFWKEIKSSTIENCFKACGFGSADNIEKENEQFDLNNNGLTETVAEHEKVFLSHSTKLQLITLMSEFDSCCFTKDVILETYGKIENLEDTQINDELITETAKKLLNCYDTEIISSTDRRKETASFIDKKNFAKQKQNALKNIQELVVFINLRVDGLDDKYCRMLLELEELIKKREKKCYKQLKIDECVKKLEKDNGNKH